jgi:site-specific DNA recombinase
MTTAALYLRVSTRDQAEEGFSLDEQRQALTALATGPGWSFRLYVDAGISGEKIDNLPGLLDLLNGAAEHRIEVVAVIDESRLARDGLTAAIIRDRLKRA